MFENGREKQAEYREKLIKLENRLHKKCMSSGNFVYSRQCLKKEDVYIWLAKKNPGVGCPYHTDSGDCVCLPNLIDAIFADEDYDQYTIWLGDGSANAFSGMLNSECNPQINITVVS